MAYKVEKQPQPGDRVLYTDPSGREQEAIVTAGWSALCVNLVVVSQDRSKTDQYGRQVERATSVTIWTAMSAHGNRWRWPEQNEAADYDSAATVQHTPPY